MVAYLYNGLQFVRLVCRVCFENHAITDSPICERPRHLEKRNVVGICQRRNRLSCYLVFYVNQLLKSL